MTTGVAHSTILGSRMIYVNDLLTDKTEKSNVAYADGTLIISTDNC